MNECFKKVGYLQGTSAPPVFAKYWYYTRRMFEYSFFYTWNQVLSNLLLLLLLFKYSKYF